MLILKDFNTFKVYLHIYKFTKLHITVSVNYFYLKKQ